MTYLGHAKYRKLSVKYLIDFVIIKLRIKKKKKNLSIKFWQFIRLEKEEFLINHAKIINVN